MTTLYAKDNSGNIRVWAIYSIDDTICIEHGVLDGEMQIQEEVVDFGLASRTLEEQIESRINSRIAKKRDSGYVDTIKEARTAKRTNALGLAKPMLAKPLGKVVLGSVEGACVQYKYDGHRCLIVQQDGVKTAYSRGGKPIETIPEILDSIKMEDGQTIDGELYAHGIKLQTITSWVKKRQGNTLLVSFYCYDIISSKSYRERYEMLTHVHFGDMACLVPTTTNINIDDLSGMLGDAIDIGYEGLILRLDGYGYEDGKRSKGLIKIKKFIDSEFTAKSIFLSNAGIPMVECELDNGKTFNVTAPGTMAKKNNMFNNKESYIGRKLTVEYTNFTIDGIPVPPIAKCWFDRL